MKETMKYLKTEVKPKIDTQEELNKLNDNLEL